VLAGKFPVRAVALGFQVADPRQQLDPGVLGGVDQVVRHVLVEQRRDVPGP
jgi:hypothetical protein